MCLLQLLAWCPDALSPIYPCTHAPARAQAAKGDRVGICVTQVGAGAGAGGAHRRQPLSPDQISPASATPLQLDAKLVERGLACTPGMLGLAACALQACRVLLQACRVLRV